MIKEKKYAKFNPVITRIKLEKQQVVLGCCDVKKGYDNVYARAGHVWCGTPDRSWSEDPCPCGLGGEGSFVDLS